MYIKDLFKEEDLNGEGDECPIDVQLQNNLPMVAVGKYGARRPAVCDFTKQRLDNGVDHVELEVMGLDCTKPEIAAKVTVQNMIDQMTWQRQLAMAVLIKTKFTSKHSKMRHGEDDSDDEGDGESTGGITLKSCFEAYSNPDLLTGDNQYYCKHCKNHTDSNK